MEKKYTQQTMERIKAFAYGLTDEEVAEHEEMSIEDVKQFRLDYAEDIADRIEAFKMYENIDDDL